MDESTYLGFTGNRCDSADFLLLQRVDDTTLSDVGVSDQTDRDLLLIRVKDRELTQKLDQGTLSERVVDGGVESDGRGGEGKVLDPSSLFVGDSAETNSEAEHDQRKIKCQQSCARSPERIKKRKRKSAMSDSKLRHASRRASLAQNKSED
jgi:hypothetical protein